MHCFAFNIFLIKFNKKCIKTQKNRQPYQLPVQSLLYSRNPGDKDLGISVYCKFSASRSHKQRLSFFSSDAFSLTYNICTYHISVLPCWPSLALAYTSSGCTWIERGFLASMSFIRIGKSSLSLQSLPRHYFPRISISSVSVLPLYSPSATTDFPSLWHDKSQASANTSPSYSIPKSSTRKKVSNTEYP